ncbi:NAD-dependent epimerase/dehydratase family protein [Nocardioides marmorisolisilvae]|uniref:NAD-dependent epimerase/dehydratase family protein n=1 Tax=Nocardioides marmorisolisilvae TaxID=1542737 RepID=A0A3N0E0D1_9ACTN|nr:NAD-dependent epimerase/dehydratase family protein [Nocardioides marmorisolisilvae]RNL81203.1 NAD-dependent epimerase/dehydratase family protein [Nocardioides marmorisolisilvae]
MGRVVLVTGVARDLGRRFARQLAAAPDVDRVIGVDVQPPRGDLGAVSFVRADIRNPVIAKVIMREHVDTVVHMSVLPSSGSGSSSAAKELNVIGTMQLLAACQQSPDLEHFVLKSSTSVYGSSNRDPAMFTEDMAAKRVGGFGFVKDINEVESYVRGFARRRPDVRTTTLRTANALGPGLNTPTAAYFKLPVIPTVLGFDPRMQFLNDTDLIDVLEHATLTDIGGTFNVAGDGVMMLSQAIRRLGRPALPLPGFAVGPLGSAMRQARVADFSREQVAFLAYGRGVDTTRMREVLGFKPSRTTEQAFGEFAASIEPGVVSERRVRAAENALVGALGGNRDTTTSGELHG